MSWDPGMSCKPGHQKFRWTSICWLITPSAVPALLLFWRQAVHEPVAHGD